MLFVSLWHLLCYKSIFIKLLSHTWALNFIVSFSLSKIMEHRPVFWFNYSFLVTICFTFQVFTFIFTFSPKEVVKQDKTPTNSILRVGELKEKKSKGYIFFSQLINTTSSWLPTPFFFHFTVFSYNEKRAKKYGDLSQE